MNYFGYKNHVNVDVEHKFIIEFEVTNAAVHDSQVVTDIIDHSDSDKALYADSPYASQKSSDQLEAAGLQNCIHDKGTRNRPLTDEQKVLNHKKSMVRSRVEHVFSVQYQRAGSLLLRGVGIV